MGGSPHSMFEDCLAVREVLQAYAPIVDGLPVHEGEAAMGRIEEQFEAQEAELRDARESLSWQQQCLAAEQHGDEMRQLTHRQDETIHDLQEALVEQRTKATLTRLDDAKVWGAVMDHAREALEAAYAEFRRAEEHHRWHHEQSADIEYHDDDERLRVLMLIAEALEELPEALPDDAETQVAELRGRAALIAGLPPDLLRVLRDPTITVPQDHEIRLADGRTLFEHLEEWRNAPSNTASAESSPASGPDR